MAKDTIILRPSADISVEHGLVPSDSEAAYLLINEEVADDAATAISAMGDEGEDRQYQSKFKMSGQIPLPPPKITSATIYMRIVGDPASSSKDRDYNDYHYVTMTIGGETLAEKTMVSSTGNSWVTYSKEDSDIVDYINNYVSVNGSFPEIILSLRSYLAGVNTEGTVTNTSYMYISQIYIELSYGSDGLNIHHKVNGTWMQAQNAYQKQNGAWIELTEEECKNILQSKQIKS